MTRRRQRRPRVLYLSFYFPPSRASGVYRARATANSLAHTGWDVTALASPLAFLHDVIGSVDEELADTVDPRIRVERPRLSHFIWEKDLHRFGRFRGNVPRLAAKLYGISQRRLFPEHYASWGLAAVGRALRLHAQRRFDVVLATGNPFASFGAAWLFHGLAGVPYVVDYRDSWTLNLFTESPAFPPDHLAWTWERRVLRNAAAAVFVNEALREWHAERYPEAADRMMVVPNGWDADLAAGLASAEPEPASADERPLRFGYLGTLTTAQPVEEMAAAFRLARRHPDLAGAQLNIHGHLGFFRNGPTELRQRLGLDLDPASTGNDDGVHYRGPVPKTQVASVYRDSDVLVFLAGGARYVTSGKIYEYMASGRPIVSVHAPGIAAKEVLAGYPLWFNANSLDVEEIAESMIAAGKAARDLTSDQRDAARRHADAYTREAVVAPLEVRLRELARPRTRAGAAGGVA